ncbi:Leucine-rich repeat [Dillenia turbinata]|uniref:Leucine-rich repeat n=1 Tax=Dillenia turbinata TaxID=194707 RepID=A0AAN8ZIW5_9MAGN
MTTLAKWLIDRDISIDPACLMLFTMRLDVSNCQSIGHLGLASFIEGSTCLCRLVLSYGCSYYKVMHVFYFTDNEIDDEGLKSISRCSKLCSLKVGICLNITDQGLISIGMSCSKLAELDLYRSLRITDVGVASVAQGCPRLQINLSYYSITDVGLLALASISQLQNMTILHLAGLTPNGLARALLASGGLTKVKLHSSFKPLLPQSLLDHMEADGCIFQRRDKALQIRILEAPYDLQMLLVNIFLAKVTSSSIPQVF